MAGPEPAPKLSALVKGKLALGYRNKPTNVHTLAMKPTITRFTTGISLIHRCRGWFYHCIMNSPSLSALLQTHLVIPLLVLDGVAPSGSVTVVGERWFEEL